MSSQVVLLGSRLPLCSLQVTVVCGPCISCLRASSGGARTGQPLPRGSARRTHAGATETRLSRAATRASPPAVITAAVAVSPNARQGGRPVPSADHRVRSCKALRCRRQTFAHPAGPAQGA
jgi:hypothetical protein